MIYIFSYEEVKTMGISKMTIDRIKALNAAGYSCVEIAKTLGIGESTVRAIVAHK